jgi:hypothetical protein
MAGTGVGGIKDSQGNYEIVGKGNSTLGTRSGTLSIPIGDVVGQTSGSMAVNVYSASTVVDPNTVLFNVQEFIPGTPPLLSGVASSLRLSKEDFAITAGTGNAERSIVGEVRTIGGLGTDLPLVTVTAESTVGTILMEAANVVGGLGPSVQGISIAVANAFAVSFGGPTTSYPIVVPFTGSILDVVVSNPSNGSTTSVTRTNSVLGVVNVVSLLATAPNQVLRMATYASANGVNFLAGDTITISTTDVNSQAKVYVYFARSTAVI